MRIGELARSSGASERALRYYEQHGLLSPRRLDSGYRIYTDRDVEQVRRIKTLLRAGLGITQIAQVMPCMVDEGTLLVPGCAEMVTGLVEQRNRMDDAIDELHATRARLTAMIARAENVSANGGDPATVR